jgi:hypothetical protein
VARIGATMAQQLRRQILKEPQSAWVSLRNSTGSEAFRPLRPPQSLTFASITCSDVGSAGYSFLMYLVNFARPNGSERRSPPLCSVSTSGVPGDDRKGHTTLAECRPKFISVAARGEQFQECSPWSTRFTLYENCYKSLRARSLDGAFLLWSQ